MLKKNAALKYIWIFDFYYRQHKQYKMQNESLAHITFERTILKLLWKNAPDRQAK